MTPPLRPDVLGARNLYRAGLFRARQRFGALEIANARAILTAITEYADTLADRLKSLPAGSDVQLATAATELVNRRAAQRLTDRIIAAIAEDRAISFADTLGIWRATSERVFHLQRIPGAALGVVRAPPVTLLGAFEEINGARAWRTVLQGHIGGGAQEAQGIIRQGLQLGMDSETLARRLRAYVVGSEPFEKLFTKVPGPAGTILSLDLRTVPRAVQGQAKLMVYNSRRLAYSELANARHEANLQHFAADPLIYAVRWLTSPDRGTARLPDQCDVLRDSDFYGMGRGLYPLTGVPPLPHPFDRCLQEPVVRSVQDADEPKPDPPLIIAPNAGTTAGMDKLSPLAQARIRAHAGDAVTFAAGAGIQADRSAEAGRRLRRILDAQQQAVALLNPGTP